MKKITLIIMSIITILSATTVDYEALHEKGRILYQTGSPQEALEVYQEILNYFPDDVDALLFRGRLFARLELYDLAEAELIHTLELAPDYLDAYYALASVYYWSGKLEDAARILTLWIEKDMENPDAFILSARVAIAGRKYAAARTFLELAGYYHADPDDIERLLHLINTPRLTTKWAAGISYEYLIVDQARPDWQQMQAFLTHDFNKILVTAEFKSYLRNNSIDNTIALDTYYKLWKKAYMNTRLQVGLNGTFMPVADVTVEVFQAIGTRHESAIGYRLMHYDSTAAHIPSVAWAIYPGKWYLRDKVSLIVNNGLNWQNQFTARFYFNDVDTYIQLMNVVGTDFDVFNNEWMQSVAFALSGSFALNENILLSSVLSWTRDEFLMNRLGGSVGFTYRW
ncbi:MAG: YaiO family outer membrane beta-barrel protein [Candidatus Marinimicrobia bacterium]|nr:YaiO family outer membrane beta-barrel protein [Candidatus Neomarinimicrobiota bacterium]